MDQTAIDKTLSKLRQLATGDRTTWKEKAIKIITGLSAPTFREVYQQVYDTFSVSIVNAAMRDRHFAMGIMLIDPSEDIDLMFELSEVLHLLTDEGIERDIVCDCCGSLSEDCDDDMCTGDAIQIVKKASAPAETIECPNGHEYEKRMGNNCPVCELETLGELQ